MVPDEGLDVSGEFNSECFTEGKLSNSGPDIGDEHDEESEKEDVGEVEQVEIIRYRRLGSPIPLGEQMK